MSKLNNFFQNCPAVMSDGRHFTDYRSATSREEYNKYINNLVRDDEYRTLLQKNAKKIINLEWNKLSSDNSCVANKCVHAFPTRMTPQLLTQQMRDYNLSRLSASNFVCQRLGDDYRLVDEKDVDKEDDVSGM
jgi:hypothetical protein